MLRRSPTVGPWTGRFKLTYDATYGPSLELLLAAIERTHDLGIFSRQIQRPLPIRRCSLRTTGGSVSSKTLDDYEEGTWTPDVSTGTQLYQMQYRYIHKIGKLVMSGLLQHHRRLSYL